MSRESQDGSSGNRVVSLEQSLVKRKPARHKSVPAGCERCVALLGGDFVKFLL